MRYLWFSLILGFATPTFGWEWDYALGGSYSAGNYGRPSTTHIAQASTALGVRSADWRLRLTALWLDVDGTRDDTSIYAIKHARGWADGYLLAEHTLIARTSWRIHAGLQAKVPFTAYASGLSSGRRDGAIHVGIQQNYLTDFIAFAQAAYWWRGDPAQIDFLNRAHGLAMLYWRVNARLATGAKVDYMTPALPGGDPQSTLTLFASISTTPTWSLIPYFLIGHGRASPRWAGGLEVRYRWGRLTD